MRTSSTPQQVQLRIQWCCNQLANLNLRQEEIKLEALRALEEALRNRDIEEMRTSGTIGVSRKDKASNY